jgi:DNA-binding NarL/FixJ family response regulator
MAIDHLENTAAAPRRTKMGSPERRTVKSYEGEPTKAQLQQALAREESLLRQIDELIRHQNEPSSKLLPRRKDAVDRVASLTPRQRQIMELVLAGEHSKTIAAHIGISQRTVENHRAAMMKKTSAKSLPELARLALAAAWGGGRDRGPR